MGLAVLAHESEEFSGHGTTQDEVLLESVIEHALVDFTCHGKERYGFAFGGEGIGAAVRFAVDVADSPCGCVGKHLTDTIEVWTQSGDREVVVARDAVDNKLRISVDVKILEITFAGLE